MRLTLRTMLAYMDEQLEPPQMDEIGQKIRESGVASGMIERIRTSIRKHRMEAPRLDGRGIGKDANSVSEYLDNVLDKDEISELEQLCLNSDMHLAEVAASHQMLSLLPKVEFNFDSDLRDRIYDIPSRLNEEPEPGEVKEEAAKVTRPKRATVKTPGAHAESSNGAKKKKKKKTPKVPEYFKNQPAETNRWLPLLFTAIVVLVGLGVVLNLTRDQWLPNFIRQTAVQIPDKGAPENKTSDNKSAEASDAANSMENSETPPNGAGGETKAPGEAAADNADKVPSETKTDSSEVPMITEGAAPPPPPGDAPGEAPPMPETPPESDKGVSLADSQLPIMIGGSPPIAWNSAEKWHRVPKGSPVPISGVIVLVGTRAECKNNVGVHATIVGPSEVRFEKEPGIREVIWALESGRLIFDAREAGGSSVKANLAGRAVQIKFVSPNAQVAIEATRQTPPGADPSNPDEYPAAVVLNIFRGAIEVKVGDATQLAESGEEGAVIEIDATGAIKELASRGAPLWVDELTAGETAKQASKELADRLAKPNDVLSVSLQELASDKRVNVASLAAQALAQLGEIKPLCDQFRDTKYRLAWRNNHFFLKYFTQSTPGNAVTVKGQLTDHFPSESQAVFRLLCGYDSEQFAAEGRQLIAGLESESSMLRVLSYQTLVDLVGPGGRKYQPEDPALTRAKHISAWIDAFEAGKLKVRDSAEAK